MSKRTRDEDSENKGHAKRQKIAVHELQYYSRLTDGLDPHLPAVLIRMVLSFCDVALLTTIPMTHLPRSFDQKTDLLPALSGRYETYPDAEMNFVVGMRLDVFAHGQITTGTITAKSRVYCAATTVRLPSRLLKEHQRMTSRVY